jgi:RecJ-like exonuclease
MSKCESCSGTGYHYAGDGMMYECIPCNSTGYSKVLSEESFGKVQKAINEPANPFLALRKLMRRKRHNRG